MMRRKRAPKPTELPFKGFIASEAFITSKGNRGTRNHILWGQAMLDAIRWDDAEIAGAALESPLADVNAVVIGGEYGSAYEIGGLAFFTTWQMERQHEAAAEHWRETHPDAFIGPTEWQTIDEGLAARSNYAPVDEATATAAAGDSLLHLSLRGQALSVASFLAESHIDLLIENRKQETAMHLIKDMFLARYRELRSLIKEKPELRKQLAQLLPDKCGPVCTLLEKLAALLRVKREQLAAEQMSRTFDHTEDVDEDVKLRRCEDLLALANDIMEAYNQRLVQLD